MQQAGRGAAAARLAAEKNVDADATARAFHNFVTGVERERRHAVDIARQAQSSRASRTHSATSGTSGTPGFRELSRSDADDGRLIFHCSRRSRPRRERRRTCAVT
jgi:hypothetical protein